jgi:hypothetical protein
MKAEIERDPPEATKWKKGQSGNPKGRPKKPTMSEHLRNMLDGKQIAGRTMPEGMSVGQYLSAQVIIRALNGDRFMTKELLDRFAPIIHFQRVEFTEPSGEVDSVHANYTTQEAAEIVRVLKEVGFNVDTSQS